MQEILAPVLAFSLIMGASALFGIIVMDFLQINYPKARAAIDRKIAEIITNW